MKRLLTAALTVPLALAAMFMLPNDLFFVLVLVVFGWGAYELVRMLGERAAGAPLWLLLVIFPAVAWAFRWTLLPGHGPTAEGLLLGLGLFTTLGLGILVLFGSTPPDRGPYAIGILAFAVPYFALAAATVTAVQGVDPWLLLWLCAIVWLGDTAAFYWGSRFGRRRLAPTVSPNKSWEGSIAGFVAALVASWIWAELRGHAAEPALFAVAAATSVAAQIGDLVESLYKRSVGIKDSGTLLPGHGGMWDRMDALLLAAPVFLAGLWMIGFPGVDL